MKVKENFKQLSKRSTDSFSSLFGKGGLLNISIADVWQESQSLWITAQCMDNSGIQNLLSILPAKQAVTVGFSSGFNMKLLHAWSNFDLPKLMKVEHIFSMPSSCLSLTLYTPGYTPVSYSLRLSQSGICGRQCPQKWIKEGSYSRRPFPSLPYPLPFFPFPYPLPLSTPAVQAKLNLSCNKSGFM